MSASDAFAAAAIAGLSRSSWRPPEGEEAGAATLRALALAAQRPRFAAPAAVALPVPTAADEMHADPRPILPPESRAAAQRLLAIAASRGEHLRAVLGRLRPLGWRLHPFDLPLIETQLSYLVEDLPDPAERGFLRLAGRPVPEPVTAETWAQETKGRRLAWFWEEVHRDRGIARRTVEPIFAKQPADVREAVAACMASRPTGDDEPFLRRMLEDRSAKVREAAAKGLSRLAGEDDRAERAREAAEGCFRRNESGDGIALVRRERGQRGPPTNRLISVSLIEIAELLGVSVEAVLQACVADRDAARCAMHGLLYAGQYELALRLADQVGVGVEELDDHPGGMRLAAEPPQFRLDLVRRLFRPPPNSSILGIKWRRIADLLDGRLPADLFLAVTTWRSWPEIRDNAISSFEFVTVAPRAAAEAALAAFEPAPAVAEPARLFLRFILTLPGDDP